MLSCSALRSDVDLCGDVDSYSVSSYVTELLMLAIMLPSRCWWDVSH